MNKLDRGMIKWQPFNSVINGKYVINNILKEKAKINKPIISDEEQKLLEEKIIEAYYCQNTVLITYYQNGSLLIIKDKIKKIDKIYKIIYLKSKTLLFNQILGIDLSY